MGRCFLCVALLAALPVWLAQSRAPETFSILMAGNAAGKVVQTSGTDGTIEIQYRFNDRGRGPEVRGRYRLDSRGFIESLGFAAMCTLMAIIDPP